MPVPPTTCSESAQVVRRVQDETGRYIACPEEIAYARGYISRQTLLRHAEELNKTLYGRYLEVPVKENRKCLFIPEPKPTTPRPTWA